MSNSDSKTIEIDKRFSDSSDNGLVAQVIILNPGEKEYGATFKDPSGVTIFRDGELVKNPSKFKLVDYHEHLLFFSHRIPLRGIIKNQTRFTIIRNEFSIKSAIQFSYKDSKINKESNYVSGASFAATFKAGDADAFKDNKHLSGIEDGQLTIKEFRDDVESKIKNAVKTVISENVHSEKDIENINADFDNSNARSAIERNESIKEIARDYGFKVTVTFTVNQNENARSLKLSKDEIDYANK